MGWTELKNGELLKKAEPLFDAFISIDQGIPFQQNYAQFDLSFIILRVPNNRVETIRAFIPAIQEPIRDSEVGKVTWVPHPPRSWQGD